MPTRKSISIFLLLSLGMMGFVALMPGVRAQETAKVLTYGTGHGPYDMDPCYAWDSASLDVLDQICEGLYAYNLSDPAAPLIPKLATGYTLSANFTQYNITLRTGVTFHDGNPFNATAAKWNFDRLSFFLNQTGTLPEEVGVTQIFELYSAQGEFLINNVEVLSNYMIQVNLTKPYGPFLDLLTFSGLYMMSPANTPVDRYLDYGETTDAPVGTGPFEFVQYVSSDFVELNAYANYWGGAAKIDKIIFDVISNAQTRNNAMLAKQITYLNDPLPDMVATFNATDGIVMKVGPAMVTIDYMIMNTHFANVTLREAMSYAFDYNYYLQSILLNQNPRLRGPIPNGMPYYNSSIPYVQARNVTAARLALIDAGLAPSGELNNNAYWTGRAAGATPIATFNLSWNTDNQIRSDACQMAQSNFADIGVKIELTGTTWGDLITRMFSAPDTLQIYTMGWAPDFNDPDNYISTLFSHTSSSNGAQLNDAALETLIYDAKFEASPTIRQTLYNQIQDKIQNELYPHLFLAQGNNRDAWLTSLKNYPSNKLGKVYFYPCDIIEEGGAVPGYELPIIAFISACTIILLVVNSRKRLVR